jgi:hypothetical protein
MLESQGFRPSKLAEENAADEFVCFSLQPKP